MFRVFLFLLVAISTTHAQDRVATRPRPFGYANSVLEGLGKTEDGYCYAQCYIPDEYETLEKGKNCEENTGVWRNTRPFFTTDPVYKEVIDSIVLKNWGQEWHYNPAAILPKGIKILDAIYKDSTQRVSITTANTALLIKRKGSSVELSQNPDNCIMFCKIPFPAQVYTHFTAKKTLKPLRKVIGRDTIALNAEECKKYGFLLNKNHQITYFHEELVKKGEIIYTKQEENPVCMPNNKVLLRRGGLCEWRRTHTPNYNRSPYTFEALEIALKAKGYDIGPKIDCFGSNSKKAALVKFQKDNGLINIGSLDEATLQALDIHKYEAQIQMEHDAVDLLNKKGYNVSYDNRKQGFIDFQRDNNLPITGNMDIAMLQKLNYAHYVTTQKKKALDLKSKLVIALRSKGYNCGTADDEYATTTAALISFQKEHNLPIGGLDVLTLQALGLYEYTEYIQNNPVTNTPFSKKIKHRKRRR
jgi:hypothetical protein